MVGAAIGGGLDYAAQVTSNYASGKTGAEAWTEVNLTSIALSAAGGALTGGIGGAVSKQVARIAGRAVINGAVNATVSAGVQVAKNAAGVNGAAGRANVFSGLENSVAWGGVTGVLGSLGGDAVEAGANLAGNGFRSAVWNSASLASKQLAVGGTVKLGATSTGWLQPAGVAVGGAASNTANNWPWNPFNSVFVSNGAQRPSK